MSQLKIFFSAVSILRQHIVRLPIVGCACVLFLAPFATWGHAQSPPPAPQNMRAWQPPVTPVTVDDRSVTAPPLFGQPKTTLTNLQPPRDIFTQRSPQPQEQLAARPLNSNLPRIEANSDFNLQNTMTEAFDGAVSQANLESTSFPSSFPSDFRTPSSSADPLAGLTKTAAEKIGGVKDWVSDQTNGLLNNATSGNASGWMDRLSSMLGGADIKKIGGSLSIVIGGYLGLVWLLRKINPAGNQGIPSEVLEVVGNAPLDNRQNLQLVRLGSKLLLMIHGPDGTQPIGEVTDPAEVDHLVALCNGRTRTANSAISHAVNRYQSNPAGVNPLNLSANQQSNLQQLLSVFDQSNRGNSARSYEA